jgi:hypothetical protein
MAHKGIEMPLRLPSSHSSVRVQQESGKTVDEAQRQENNYRCDHLEIEIPLLIALLFWFAWWLLRGSAYGIWLCLRPQLSVPLRGWASILSPVLRFEVGPPSGEAFGECIKPSKQ